MLYPQYVLSFTSQRTFTIAESISNIFFARLTCSLNNVTNVTFAFSLKKERKKKQKSENLPQCAVPCRSCVTWWLYPRCFVCCSCALQPSSNLTFPEEQPQPQPKHLGCPCLSVEKINKSTQKTQSLIVLKQY